MVGSFRFDSINSRLRGRRGWNVSGCYCPANRLYCDCSRASNRVRMFINQRQKSAKKVRYRSRKKTGNGVVTTTIRIRSGCFCDTSGCRGTSCNRLDGCVCNRRGRCWGNRCSTMSMDRSEDLERLKNRIVFSHDESSLNNLVTNETQVDQTNSATNELVQDDQSTMSNIDGCLCDEKGCFGHTCTTMEGCFCTSNGCWGLYCDTDETSIEERFLKTKLKGLKGMKGTKGLQIGQTWPTPSDVGDVLNGKVNFLTGKINSIFDAKKVKFNTLKGKFTHKIKGVQAPKLKGKPMNLTDSIGIETLLGKEIHTIKELEALKKVTGQDIPVIKGYPIDSVIGIPLDKWDGVEVHSTPGSMLKAISGNPAFPIPGVHLPKTSGQQLEEIEGFPMKIPESFHPNVQKFPGVPIKNLTHPITSVKGYPVKRLPQSQIISPAIRQPMGLTKSHLTTDFWYPTNPTNTRIQKFADWKRIYSSK